MHIDASYYPAGQEWEDPNALVGGWCVGVWWARACSAVRVRAGNPISQAKHTPLPPTRCPPSLYPPSLSPTNPASLQAFEQDLAARGDAEAQRQLGYRMLTGNGVARDPAGAHAAFQAAARGGDE